MEERLLASGQNRCSAKLETGRTVGKAQIKNVLPTWTQYTAALIRSGNLKPNSTILCPSQQNARCFLSDTMKTKSNVNPRMLVNCGILNTAHSNKGRKFLSIHTVYLL